MLVKEAETIDRDWERIGGALTNFTAELPNKPPAYEPLSTTFHAVSDDENYRLGQAIVTRNQGMCEIDLLIVPELHRGKGVGTRLLSHIEDFARAHGDLSIRLSTPTWQGEGFYEKCGYTEMGRVPLWSDRHGKPQHQITYFKTLDNDEPG